MSDILPQWAVTLIISVISGIVGIVAGRRLYKATASEKEANAAKTLSALANDLAEQLERVTKALFIGSNKILEQELEKKHIEHRLTLSNNLAEDRMKTIINLEGRLADVDHREPLGLDTAQIIRKESAVIVENVSHLSYLRSPDEPESIVEQRFKAIKEAAKKIADLKI